MGFGPYLKSTPRNWFFRTTEPEKSPEPPETESEPILTDPDLSDRPRTTPENHEPVEDDEEADEVDERFMSEAPIECHYYYYLIELFIGYEWKYQVKIW